jgi:ATP-dependent Clp protease ATP-binding subunit ClpA
MNFKIGNKVVIKNNLKIGQKYGSKFFNGSMKCLIGKVVEIVSINEINKGYGIKESEFIITESMIWRKATKEESNMENNDSLHESMMRLGDAMSSLYSNPNPMVFTWGDMSQVKCKTKEIIEPKKILKPFEIKAKLDEYIIGQEEAKTILSVAAYNHYRRINYNPSENEIKLQKSNVLLVGKSGMGKTLLASTLAKILDVPFVTADITDFTPMGIVGREAGDIIKDSCKG